MQGCERVGAAALGPGWPGDTAQGPSFRTGAGGAVEAGDNAFGQADCGATIPVQGCMKLS